MQSPGYLSDANQEHSVVTRMGPQQPQHLCGGIRLGAEVVSPGGTGKSLEMLEGGNREEKSSPVLIEGEKAPSAGQAGLSEMRPYKVGQGSLTSPLPVPCVSIGV